MALRAGIDIGTNTILLLVADVQEGMVARVLEAHGIATVIMGAARDVVEHCGVPRLLFSDLPLGHSAGLPYDVASQ